MEKREHDIFMEMLDNPTASFDTMVTVGLTPTNTSLQDRNTYKQDPWVQSNFKNSEGNFDEITFNKLYDTASIYYNNLARASYEDSAKKQLSFHRDNIWAPVEQRRSGPDFKQIKISNPYGQIFNLNTLGKIDQPTKSVDEQAQAHKTLLNPTTAGDNLENAIWDDSPNDSFFKNFFDTLVLAQYDSDGTHKDPITGEIVNHKKGDLRVDDEGEFYYEKLDGRDVYGRRVLHKTDILTVDGSKWNDYDFFDSDNINQKSIGGTALKNLALVGSMFIPYVGPWIAGLSIATQVAGLGATLGKMLSSSDSPTLSAIEGWSKSLDRQTAKTQYAQEHTWCWENFISLIGDVAGQLKEQRFIFEKLPYVFKGADITTKSGQAKKLKEFQKQYEVFTQSQIKAIQSNPKSLLNAEKQIRELKAVEAVKAQSDLDSFIKGYQKIGEIFSKGYMTAITVGDTFEEAKLAGASDLDATLLTLGYAAGEYALLNTGIGEWILPELRASRYKSQAIAKALTSLDEETVNLRKAFGNTLKNIPKEGKKEYVKRLFNIGKGIATAEYATGSRALSATLAAGAGEGIEEVSEEFLADFSKGCFDVVKWLQGDNTRLNSFGYDFSKGKWNSSEVIDRYGMSLVGGAIGGSLTNTFTNYSQFKSLDNMTSQKAIQELVYMARNGGLQDFIKQVDKMDLGDKNLSATQFIEQDGVLIFAPGTSTNNQDLFAKQAIKQQVKLIESILEANGANLSDESFLNDIIGDLRFGALSQSTTAGDYLNRFNTLTSNLVKLTNQLNEKLASSLDSNQDGTVSDIEQRRNKLSEEDKKIVKKLESDIKEIQSQISDLVEGKKSYEFISTALFEMTNELSQVFTTTTFPLYVKKVLGKEYSEISEDEKATLWEQYEQWKTGEGRDRIREMASVYRYISEQSSKTITDQGKKYIQQSKYIQDLNKLISQLYIFPNGKIDDSLWLETIQEVQDSIIPNLEQSIIFQNNSEESISRLRELYSQAQDLDKNLSGDELKKKQLEIQNTILNTITNTILNNLDTYIQPILDNGFINAESKNQINNILNKLIDTSIITYEQYQDDPLSINEEEYWMQQIQKLQNVKEEINQLSTTPFEQNLNEFVESIGKDPINITQLIERLNKSFQEVSDDISKFNMDIDLYRELDNAITTVEIYRASILGARTDSAGLDNYYGYNATLNELSTGENQKLAEIDSQTADIFVQDIDINLNKLKFLRTLYQVNQGQKLSKQDRVSTKKDLLIYKRFKALIAVPDDDKLRQWNGFLELVNIVDGMKLHKQFLSSNNIPKEFREDFEREKIQLEDAIYKFFQDNQEKLKDINKLIEFVNPKKFQMYTKADKLLNEDLESIDDNSMLWWIAGRAAIKSSDFYYQYKQIIDPNIDKPLAPIPTQELAVFNNYASIVNGNVFSQFYKAIRQSMVDDWKSKSQQQREDLLKLIGNPSKEITSDELADYALNIAPVPRYLNIILTEGIPGSGKTSAVFKQTIELLKRFHPQLLNSVAVVHGAELSSAQKFIKDVELDKLGKAYGREEWMKEINPQWKELSIDPITQKYIVPKSAYVFTDQNEIVSSAEIKETSTPPSLIIIDEISRFTSYDLDQIDKYAKKYGITVLVAGDFDQTGVSGTHPIKIANNKFEWIIENIRTNFIRSPKLGVSMRTDNSIKTSNLQIMQAFMQNITQEGLKFRYYQDETGLYGDRIINYDKGENITQLVIDEIEKLKDTLQPGEKIGYIYSDRNSPIYHELSQDKYKEYIDLKEGGSAQGLEAQYYIIEPSSESNQYLREIYTGISRAQQGSILLIPSDSPVKFSSDRVNTKVDENIGPLSIKNYSNKRKTLLDSIVPSGSNIQYIPRDKFIEQTVKPQSSTQQGGLNPGIDSTPVPQTQIYQDEKNKLINAIVNAPSLNDINRLVNDFYTRFTQVKDDPDVLNAIQQRFDYLINELIQKIDKVTNEEELDQLILSLNNDPILENDTIVDKINSKRNKFIPKQKSDQEEHKQEEQNPIEEKEPEQIETLTYEDEINPIVDTDIIPEEDYKKQIDESSQSENIPATDAIEDTDTIRLEMLLHTFNTFETGVLIDSNGMPILNGGKEWADLRIDSINGLIKIDQYKNTSIQSVKDYIDTLGRLRSYLFNYEDKSEIIKNIQEDLELPNIYLTFALKSSPNPSDNNRENQVEFVEDKPSKFTKGISERTIFNGSSDERSSEWNPKSIVAIIGTKETGDILELPLLILSSPFTLLQVENTDGTHIFDELNARFKALKKSGEAYHNISVKLIKEFENNPKYSDLIKLFKLFNFTDRSICYIKDASWTPAKNLTLEGPQFVTNRGFYQGLPGFGYDANSRPENEWITVKELSERSDCVVTKKIMTSISGKVDTGNNTSMQIVNPGHSFVLVSFDRDINTDEDIVNYYIRQKIEGIAPKVKLMYVLPPKATLQEYIENLKRIITKEGNTKPIGQLFTSYKLLKILLDNNTFVQELDKRIPGIVNKLRDTIYELDSLPDNESKKNRLYEPRDWSDTGLTSKVTKLAGLFDRVLVEFLYDKNTLNMLIGQDNFMRINNTRLQLVSNILQSEDIDGIYYNVKIPKGNVQKIGPFHVPTQDNYTLDGNPFRIHGKLDSYVFKGYMGWLVDSFLKGLRPSKKGDHMFHIDGYSYSNDNNSNIFDRTITPEQKQKNNLISEVKNKTGLDVSQIYKQNTIEEANKQVVNLINSSSNNQIAFIIGNELKISNIDPNLTGLINLLDNGVYTVDISKTANNNGIYSFVVNIGTNTFDAEFNSNTNELVLTPRTEEQQLQQLSIPAAKLDYNKYKESVSRILEGEILWEDLEEIFQLDNYNDFINSMDNFTIIDDYIDDLEEIKSKLDNKDDIEVIQQLIDCMNKKLENDNVGSCPMNIIIKF